MSAKNLDKHNRWRSKTVAFRMSPEEANTLDEFVKLSGLTKQDYLIDRALQRDVKVQGNPRVYKALRNELTSLCDELATASPEDMLEYYTKEQIEKYGVVGIEIEVI